MILPRKVVVIFQLKFFERKKMGTKQKKHIKYSAQDIESKVKEILLTNLALDQEELDLDKSDLEKLELQAQLGAESIDIMNISFELERAFKIMIPKEEWKSWTTIVDLISCITKHLTAQNVLIV